MTALRGLAGERPRTAAAPVRVPRTSILPPSQAQFLVDLLRQEQSNADANFAKMQAGDDHRSAFLAAQGSGRVCYYGRGQI